MTTVRSERMTLQRVPASSALYGEILDFLHDEISLLNHERYDDWLALMADDLRYHMPQRNTLRRGEGPGFEDWSGAAFYRDDKHHLRLRVRRTVDLTAAYDQDPAARVRRFLANVIVHERAAGHYDVESSVLLYRNRFDDPTYDMLSLERQDVLRRTDGGFEIAERLVLTDQVRPGTPWINVFV